MKQNQTLQLVAIFAAGVLFALGLGIAGMTQPTKVIGFLDVAGKWDATLMVVLAAATGTTMIAFRFVLRRPNPILAERFMLPTSKHIDGKLVGGAVLFGAGWAIGGFCPGPAIVAGMSGLSGVWVFLGSMAVGSFVYAQIANRMESNTEPPAEPKAEESKPAQEATGTEIPA